MNKGTVCAAAALMIACAAAFAQKATMQPGEYLDSMGGHLILKPGKGSELAFTLHTVSTQHIGVCDADGVVGANGVAVLKPEPCRLYFTAKPDGIEVALKENCPAYCGVGATLDGMYYKPEAGCDRAGVRKARAEFKKLYDRKSYAEARKTLEPLVDRCKKTLADRDDGWMRNDLALAQLRSGSAAECRKTLEPLAAMAAKSDATLREDFGQSASESWLPIARATRTNLKLCQEPAAKGK